MKKIELAGAIILDKDNRILLIHRNTPELKQWELPGGKLEKDERRITFIHNLGKCKR